MRICVRAYELYLAVNYLMFKLKRNCPVVELFRLHSVMGDGQVWSMDHKSAECKSKNLIDGICSYTVT